MTGKTALGTICAGFTLLIALRSNHQTIQATALIFGSGLLGYTTTTFVLDCQRQHKTRMADAEAYLEFLQQINQERLSRVPPMPPACKGCCHYHGQTYGGNLLVCAMHPYGADGEQCSDWQHND